MNADQLAKLIRTQTDDPDLQAAIAVCSTHIGMADPAAAAGAIEILIPDPTRRATATKGAENKLGAVRFDRVSDYIDRVVLRAEQGVNLEPELERRELRAMLDPARVAAVLAENVAKVASDVAEAVGRVQFALYAEEIDAEVAKLACEALCPDVDERQRHIEDTQAMIRRTPPILMRALLAAGRQA